jgi:drug/metabolite transporter (DMT)-like permease
LKPTALPFIQVLLAAALFGASAPLAKLLLDDVQPVMLAALLYLGSGIGLAALRLVLNLTHKTANREARIERADLPWLGGAYLAGGSPGANTITDQSRTHPGSYSLFAVEL